MPPATMLDDADLDRGFHVGECDLEETVLDCVMDSIPDGPIDWDTLMSRRLVEMILTAKPG